MNYFVTGTDTGVGKTYVTGLWIEALRAEGVDAVGYKPVCSGDRGDVEVLARVSGGLEWDEVNPEWRQAAVAPWVAGMLENRPVDPERLIEGYRRLAAKHRQVLVEGAGGWRVPLAEGFAVSDLAAALGLPVVVVVGNCLGALNHAMLTVESVRAAGLEVAGLILNPLADELDTAAITNKGVIEAVTGARLLTELIYGQDFLDLEEMGLAVG